MAKVAFQFLCTLGYQDKGTWSRLGNAGAAGAPPAPQKISPNRGHVPKPWTALVYVLSGVQVKKPADERLMFRIRLQGGISIDISSADIDWPEKGAQDHIVIACFLPTHANIVGNAVKKDTIKSYNTGIANLTWGTECRLEPHWGDLLGQTLRATADTRQLFQTIFREPGADVDNSGSTWIFACPVARLCITRKTTAQQPAPPLPDGYVLKWVGLTESFPFAAFVSKTSDYDEKQDAAQRYFVPRGLLATLVDNERHRFLVESLSGQGPIAFEQVLPSGQNTIMESVNDMYLLPDRSQQ